VFDAWIQQFVEAVEGVDVQKWQIFHRWNIINAMLQEEVLALASDASGYALNCPSETAPELARRN
jgi:hypothetical protein